MNVKVLYVSAITLLVASAAVGEYIQQSQTSLGNQIHETNSTPQEMDSIKPESEQPQESTQDSDSGSTVYTLQNGVTITFLSGLNNGKVTSPLTIRGSAPSSKSVNEKYTIRLIDPSGDTIVNNSVSINSSNAGNNSSNFRTTLSFSTSAGGTGSLHIDGGGDSITIPVEF